VHFHGLLSPAINQLRELRLAHPEIDITFSEDLSYVTANWEGFDSLSRLTRIAATIEIQKRS
jgi:hypothetical protein